MVSAHQVRHQGGSIFIFSSSTWGLYTPCDLHAFTDKV